MTHQPNRKISIEQEKAIMSFEAEYRQYVGPMKKSAVLENFLRVNGIRICIRQAQRLMARKIKIKMRTNNRQ